MTVTSFSQLKTTRQAQLDKLYEELNKQTAPQGRTEDDRFWQPTVDKAGNGYAVIRFLPAPAGEDVPYIKMWSHGFKGPSGSWYIEQSLTTIGKPDPVGDFNGKLWNSGIEADKAQARKQKRNLTFISNIMVIKDPANPDNDGKVFLYKYGKKIFDKLIDLMNPQFEDEKPINPFDFWEGANFKLKIRMVDGYRNYDKSEFDSVSAVASSDKEIEKIWNKQHSLQAFLDPKNFKSYEELQTRLNKVLNAAAPKPTSQPMSSSALDSPISAPGGKSVEQFDEDEDFDKLMEKLGSDD